jgi:hypothetical protein
VKRRSSLTALARTGRRLVLAAAGTAAIVAMAATPARAATYQVEQCHDANMHVLDVYAGFFQTINIASVGNNCFLEKGAVGLNVANNAVSENENWQQVGFGFTVPATMPNTRIMSSWALMTVLPKTGDSPTTSYGDIKVQGGDGTQWGSAVGIPPGNWDGFTDWGVGGSSDQGSRTVTTLLRCYGVCRFKDSGPIQMRRAVIVLDDPVIPAVPSIEPVGLVDGSPQRGTRVLRVDAQDADSGVRSMQLRLEDGTVVAGKDGTPDCSWTRPTPCPQTWTQADLSVDTTKIPEGSQKLELWTYDAVGNIRKLALAPIVVDNVPDAAAPVVRAAPKVTFSLSKTKLRRGGTVKFTGTITPAPAVGIRVILEAHKGKRWVTAAVVKTRQGGTFKWSHRFTHRGTLHLRARLLDGDATVAPGFSKTKKMVVR